MDEFALDRILRRLGLDPRDADLSPLGGGSGSTTLLVSAASGRYVLKYAHSSSTPDIKARFRREIAFYRKLAPLLPLPTPTLCGYLQGDEGHALLLEAYTPSLPAAAWPPGMYVWAAEILARLHSQEYPPWLERKPAPRGDPLVWLRVVPDDPVVLRGVQSVSYLLSLVDSLSHGICHGDCHTGNFLIDHEGNLLLADWQEVHLDSPAWDLGFLIGRAVAEGGMVPEEDVLETYAEARDIPLRALEQAVSAAEAWIILTQWPFYLSWDELRQRLFDRLRELLGRLL